jgi:hypothetical protein
MDMLEERSARDRESVGGEGLRSELANSVAVVYRLGGLRMGLRDEKRDGAKWAAVASQAHKRKEGGELGHSGLTLDETGRGAFYMQRRDRYDTSSLRMKVS